MENQLCFNSYLWKNNFSFLSEWIKRETAAGKWVLNPSPLDLKVCSLPLCYYHHCSVMILLLLAANRSSILNLLPIIKKNLSNVDQAADLDRVGDRAPRALQGRDHGEGQVPVQATVDGQQRRDLHPRSQRRRLAKVQDDHRPLQIRARTGSPRSSLD